MKLDFELVDGGRVAITFGSGGLSFRTDTGQEFSLPYDSVEELCWAYFDSEHFLSKEEDDGQC